MNKSIISNQLKHDYPDYKIHLDAGRRMVVADDKTMSLLNSSSALETMNIFSRSGRSFYQAITQLLCTHYNILPAVGSYAETLIILPEDLKKYKIQKLAKEWGIGFLETNKDVMAVRVETGIQRDLLLESPKIVEEIYDEENLPELTGPPEEEEWAELVEINFDDEIKFLEKGIEFAEDMEYLKNYELETIDELNEMDNIEEKIKGSELKDNIKGFFKYIRNILK